MEILNGTFINIHMPNIDKPRYQIWKEDIAINVFGVCDQNMIFIFIQLCTQL